MSRNFVSTLMLSLILVGLISSLTDLSLKREAFGSNRAFASLVSDYQNITTHEGDLIITGTRSYAIQNCTYVQRGNIYLKDYAKLVILNAAFEISGEYPWQFNIDVQDYANLTMENVDAKRSLNSIRIRDHARTRIRDTKDLALVSCSGHSIVDVNNLTLFDSIGLGQNSLVTVEDSKVSISLNGDPNQAGSLSQLKPGVYSYWNLHMNQSLWNVNYDLTIRNTRIDQWYVGLDCQTVGTISNSQLSIGISFGHVTTEIKDLGPGLHGKWNYGAITLENCSISIAEVYLSGTSCTVTNSTVFFFVFESQWETNVSLVSSTLQHFQCDRGFGSIHFYGTKFDRSIRLRFLDANLFVDGDLESSVDIRFEPWVSSNITRDFNIIAQNSSHNPVEKVELNLLDKNENVVWNGTTDSLGKTNFNLAFADNNYTEILRLDAYKEGCYSFTTNVSFLSDTPIAVNLTQKPLGDINEDRVVNILDISLVAYSFGCISGDERWNETCDLNKDAEINILDISMTARDYGKTV